MSEIFADLRDTRIERDAAIKTMKQYGEVLQSAVAERDALRERLAKWQAVDPEIRTFLRQCEETDPDATDLLAKLPPVNAKACEAEETHTNIGPCHICGVEYGHEHKGYCSAIWPIITREEFINLPPGSTWEVDCGLGLLDKRIWDGQIICDSIGRKLAPCPLTQYWNETKHRIRNVQPAKLAEGKPYDPTDLGNLLGPKPIDNTGPEKPAEPKPKQVTIKGESKCLRCDGTGKIAELGLNEYDPPMIGKCPQCQPFEPKRKMFALEECRVNDKWDVVFPYKAFFDRPSIAARYFKIVPLDESKDK